MGNDKNIVIKIVNRKFKDDVAVKDLIKYILTDKRYRDMRRCVGGKGVCFLNWEKAAEEFEIIQELYRKKSKKRIYHMMISFPEEEDDIYSIWALGQRVAEDIFNGHQCVFAVHEDTDNLHIHIAWNSVNYRNGKKWHMSRSDFKTIKGKITEMWKMN